MNQPPNQRAPAQWRRPDGVTPGIWTYVNQRTIADHYDAFVADTPLCRLDAAILRSVFPDLPVARSQWVADLGCGSGRAAITLGTRGYGVLAIDLSQAMLEVLRNKVDYSDDPAIGERVHSIRANLVQLDGLASASVDHAVCLFSTLGMIQGRANRRQVLSSVARIVRPSGILVLHVHHRWSALMEPQGIGKLVKSWWRSLRTDTHEFGDTTYSYRGIEDMFMHRFSKNELQTDVADTGWSVEQWHCLSIDGADVITPPRLMRHRIGGFIVIARRVGSDIAEE